MRLVIIEKHEALKWVKNGVVVKNFEAPGWNEGKSETQEKEEEEETAEVRTLSESAPVSPTKAIAEASHETDQVQTPPSKIPSHWAGLFAMMINPRALTCFTLTLLNGFIFGGLADSAMTIYLNDAYGLNSQGAGLVYLGIVAPVFFVRFILLHRAFPCTDYR